VKVVFDTNIYISALVFPGGSAEKALHHVIDGNDQLIISKAIIGELLGVLARKFSRDAEQLARTAVLLSEIAVTVKTGRKLKVLADEADNRILECAVAGKANLIVTGDSQMLALGEYKSIQISTLRAYLGKVV
jgi:putative PIN family toxin of toxin-antitoxin system